MFVDERKRQAIANPKAGAVPAGAAALAAQGRDATQGPANFAGTATGPKAVRNGAMPPPPVRVAPAPMPVAQPAQVANRGFRGQTVQRPMIQQMARAAPTIYTKGEDPFITRAQGMSGKNYGRQDTSQFSHANVRAGAVPTQAPPMQAAGFVPMGAGNTAKSNQGAVQTRRDEYIAGEGQTDPDELADRSVGDTLAFGNNGGYGSNRGNTNTRHGWYNNGTGIEIGPGGAQLVGDGIPGATVDNNTGNLPGSNGAGSVGGPASGKPEDVIRWLTEMFLDAAGGAIGPAADFANKLNDVTRPELLDYFGNFADLDNVKASGDRFMDPEFYKQYDNLQREQLRSDVDRNRDAMMRTALSRQAGGGRGMSGNFAGQVMDSSNRAISEGNRGIAQDSLQRQLSGTQAGAQMKQGAQAMIYDLMNQGRTDPREILAFISEVAPEMMGSALEFLGELAPG